MFKVKWYDLEPGATIKRGNRFIPTLKVQEKVMKAIVKQLKADKMKVTGSDEAGRLIYT